LLLRTLGETSPIASPFIGVAGEEAQRGAFCHLRLFPSEVFQRFIGGEWSLVGRLRHHPVVEQVYALLPASLFQGLLLASVVHRDAPDSLGSHRKEMARALPAKVPLPDQPQVRLVHQGVSCSV
jgi:hypothetical protein